MTNESNFVATLQYRGSRNYYMTKNDSECFSWRRDWADRFGGLFLAFTCNDADALLEKARATPFEPGGALLVKTIYEARSDERALYIEIHEAVGFSLIERRISRADQDKILREYEPQGRFFLGADKEAEWTSSLAEHPRLKEINATRFDVSVWFTQRRIHG